MRASQVFEQFPETRTGFSLGQKDQVTPLTQEHGSKVVYVPSLDKAPFVGDGAFTDRENLQLTVRTADCVAILFYNPNVKVIGAVHAGWRGTASEIVKKAMQAVQEQFGAAAEDFYFYLGPAAQTCCYERDFVQENIRQLKSLGVPDAHIENSGICTIHNHEYPSHRREGSLRNQAAFSSIRRVV